jgi:hypothetical protein
MNYYMAVWRNDDGESFILMPVLCMSLPWTGGSIPFPSRLSIVLKVLLVLQDSWG